jgi:hypothetical protein
MPGDYSTHPYPNPEPWTMEDILAALDENLAYNLKENEQ